MLQRDGPLKTTPNLNWWALTPFYCPNGKFHSISSCQQNHCPKTNHTNGNALPLALLLRIPRIIPLLLLSQRHQHWQLQNQEPPSSIPWVQPAHKFWLKYLSHSLQGCVFPHVKQLATSCLTPGLLKIYISHALDWSPQHMHKTITNFYRYHFALVKHRVFNAVKIKIYMWGNLHHTNCIHICPLKHTIFVVIKYHLISNV